MSSNWKTGAIAQRRVGLKNSCGFAYLRWQAYIIAFAVLTIDAK